MSEANDEPARFRGATPIRPIVWAALALVITFMNLGATIVGLDWTGPNDPHWVIHLCIFWIAVLSVPCLILFWPRPRFVREICISAGGIRATDRGGRTIRIDGTDLRMISAEAVMSWEDRRTNPWGRLYIRSQNQWIAMRFYGSGGADCYQAAIRRFPDVLGIPGKGEIDLPMIRDAATFSDWAVSVRQLVGKELRRQIAFNLLNAMLLALFVCVFAFGLIGNIWQKRAMSWSAGEFMLEIFIFAGLGGMIAFFRAAIARVRLLHKVVGQLNKAATGCG